MPIYNYPMKYMSQKEVSLIFMELLAIKEFFQGSNYSTEARDHKEKS